MTAQNTSGRKGGAVSLRNDAGATNKVGNPKEEKKKKQEMEAAEKEERLKMERLQEEENQKKLNSPDPVDPLIPEEPGKLKKERTSGAPDKKNESLPDEKAKGGTADAPDAVTDSLKIKILPNQYYKSTATPAET